jgi:hypothetical protein
MAGLPDYRANEADQRAWDSALRPKACLRAIHVKLRTMVASKLILDWSPEQISGWLKIQRWKRWLVCGVRVVTVSNAFKWSDGGPRLCVFITPNPIPISVRPTVCSVYFALHTAGLQS